MRRIRLAVTRRTNADHTNLARLAAIAAEAARADGLCLDAPALQAPLKLEKDRWGLDQDGSWSSRRGGDESGQALGRIRTVEPGRHGKRLKNLILLQTLRRNGKNCTSLATLARAKLLHPLLRAAISPLPSRADRT